MCSFHSFLQILTRRPRLQCQAMAICNSFITTIYFIKPLEARMRGTTCVPNTQNMVAKQRLVLEVLAQRKWSKSLVNTITRQGISNNQKRSFSTNDVLTLLDFSFFFQYLRIK